jgi:transcriptional regulator with XRE-family HTH domain
MIEKKYFEKLKSLRELKGLSQELLSNKLGISRTSYINVEKGDKELTVEQLETAAKYFGVSLSDFLENKEAKKKKYEQMLFMFLRKIGGDGKIPKTKLAKLLYLADFSWFYKNYESMSGMEYRKITHGPVPDDYFVLLEELDGKGKINIQSKGKALLISETRVGEKIGSDLLSKDEKKNIEKVVSRWKNKSTKEIVDFTHNQIPYSFVDDGDVIPYKLITQEDPDHVI